MVMMMMTTTAPAFVDEDWVHLRAQVRRMLGSRLASGADADDVVQDVLLRILRNVSSLRDGACFGAWLSTMVKNAVADQLRARQRHPAVPRGSDDDLEADSPVAERSDDAARDRVAAALRPFAERLPVLYREVIILSELEGVPHAEIARRLAISVSGVKSRVRRGREQLRNMLTECCEIALDARRAIVDCVPKTAAPVPDCCPPKSPVLARGKTQ
jgi:RNA polymerase sigma-70 factor (ECF subfamily)